MTMRDIAFVVALAVAVGLLSSLASTKSGTPDREAAVAAALQSSMKEFLPGDEMYEVDPRFGYVVICLESEVRLDTDRVADRLGETVIRPVPVSECVKETVYGDFGMFIALDTYFDRNGKESAHVKVADVECATTSDCIVDLDWRGNGESFVVKRRGQTWQVTEQKMRWVV